jgi:small subunit ribosomal protein S18
MVDAASDETERTEAAPPPGEPASLPVPEPERSPAAPAAIAPAPERAHGSDAAPERRRRHFGRRRVCAFCVDKASVVDYKDAVKLRRYLSDRARIEPRRKTGTCAKHQRWLAIALKRARHLALLPYAPEHIRLTGMSTVRR